MPKKLATYHAGGLVEKNLKKRLDLTMRVNLVRNLSVKNSLSKQGLLFLISTALACITAGHPYLMRN